MSTRLKVVLNVGILILLVYLLDFQLMMAYVKKTSVSAISSSFVLLCLSYALACVKWIILARKIVPSAGSLALADIYFIGLAGNLWLPTGFLGDAGRVSLIMRHGRSLKDSTLIVIVDRVTSFVPIVLASCVGVALVVLGFGALLVSLSLVAVLAAYGISILLFPKKLFDGAQGAMFHFLWIAIGALSSACLFLAYVPLIIALGQSVADVLPLVPLSLSMVALPISFGGWGLREASLGLALQYQQMDAEVGVVLSSAVGVLSMFCALICVCVVRLMRMKRGIPG